MIRTQQHSTQTRNGNVPTHQKARFNTPTTAPATATSPAALANVLDLISTAALIQDVLAEAFGKSGARFYVKTQQADTHTRIHVEWVDGPTETQVSKILLPLQSSTPGTFGGLTPVEHFRITPTGPQKLTLAADRITVKRGFSAGLITNVLQRLAHRHAGRIDPETRKLLTVEAFRKGALVTVVLFGIHFAGNSLATDVETALHAHSDVQGFPRSATASAIFTRKPLKA